MIKKLLAPVILTALIAPLAYSYSQAPQINHEHHTQYSDNLIHTVKELEKLEAEILKVERGHNTHYDFIEVTLQDIKRRIKATPIYPQYIASQPVATRIQLEAEKLNELYASLDNTVQQFKRHFSLLRNSRNHLPSLISDLTRVSPPNSTEVAELSNIVRRVVEATLLRSDTATRDLILSDLETIKPRLSALKSAGVDIGMLSTHVEIALLYDQKLNEHATILHNELIPDATSALNKIMQLYGDAFLSTETELAFMDRIQFVSTVALFLLLTTFVLTQLINKRRLELALADFSRVLDAQAHGDFSTTVTKHYKGKLFILSENINAMSGKLSGVLTLVRSLTGNIRCTADHIAEFSGNYENQIQSTTDNIRESDDFLSAIHTNSKDFSNSADNAKSTASECSSYAERGANALDSTVTAMQDIHSAAEQMEIITENIDSIAFQTNLLALNAAVEAARAGENGAGFAVVAGEVRNLSKRTTTASREIRDLIAETKLKIENGNDLMRQTHDEFSSMKANIDNLSTEMENISSTSKGQESNVGKVSDAISIVSNQLQGSLGDFQQVSKLARKSAEESDDLEKLVNRFKLAS